MENITAEYLSRAEAWLLITTLIYFFQNGAQIFQTTVIVPKWTAAPPESLQMFKGKYALNFKAFWIVVHSVHEITFIIAIIFCWKLEFIRNWLLILFAVHGAVRIWTIVYFAPHIIAFQTLANSAEVTSSSLSQRVARWKNLNYLRVSLFVAVSFALVPLVFHLVKIR